MKEAERAAFGRALRAALDGHGARWEEDSEDAVSPLNRYLKDFDSSRRSGLILDADRLFAFGQEHLTDLFKLADAIDAQLATLSR